MSENAPAAPAPHLARWQQGLLGLAVLVGVAGVALTLYAAAGGDPAEAGGRTMEGVSGLASGAVAERDSLRDSAREYAPFMWQGALAFVLAFCVGTALRKSLRVAIAVLGFAILVVIGLQVAGVYEVDWDHVREGAKKTAEKVDARSEEWIELALRHTGSAIAGAIGVITGFIRA